MTISETSDDPADFELHILGDVSAWATEQKVIKLARFSSLKKLLCCTARVFRFVDNCRKQKDQQVVGANLTSEELRSVKICWIQSTQHEMTECKEFKQGSQDLGVFQHEDGFLHCGGRL